jgi:NAD(P)H-hydrate epimerase
MKHWLVRADEMRRMDRLTIEEVGIPGHVLMENAGRQAADILMHTFAGNTKRHAGVLAGRGNNGGDGFVIARVLASRGWQVTVYVLSSRDRIAGDALANLLLLEAMNMDIRWLATEAAFQDETPRMAGHDVLVDALLGTGLNQEVRGLYRLAIEAINASKLPVFSVDIPSGLDADSGKALGCCVQAHTTVTFGFAKIGHVVLPGARFTGKLHVADIGIPPSIADRIAPTHACIDVDDFGEILAKRSPESHKGRNGHCLIVAGSRGKVGAAGLAARAALRSGAGLVTIACPSSIQPILHGLLMEAMTEAFPETPSGTISDEAFDPILDAARGKTVLALGPGLGQDAPTVRLVHQLVSQSPVPLVIDADGLNAIAQHPETLLQIRQPAILTPHPGEMARLAGTGVPEIQSERIRHARSFATRYGCYLILKGARSILALPDGFVYVNPTGNPGMATAGMGDVLTGMIAGFMAQGFGPGLSCLAAVYLHGAAGDRLARNVGPRGYLASELADVLPSLFQEMESFGNLA